MSNELTAPATAAFEPSLPAPIAAPISGLSPPRAGFTDGTDGTPRLSWARYRMDGLDLGGAGFGWGYGGYATGYSQYANVAHRNRPLASTISTEFIVANPTIRTVLDTLTTQAIGTGLTLSSKPDAPALGITPEEARALSHAIETKWTGWANNPLEADSAGRHTLHEIAAAAFMCWLTTGEMFVAFDWRRTRDARTATKVALLSPNMIDSRSQEDGDLRVFQGIAFDKRGRMVGVYMRRPTLGSTVTAAPSLLVPLRTGWGRSKLLFHLDLIQPGQVRGLSPIVAALTSAHERSMLQELTVAGTALQNTFALTVESSLPPAAAMRGLEVDDRASGAWEAGLELREQWYNAAKIQIEPGVVNHLAPGDALKMNRPQALTSHYADFEKSLTREAARAAGAMVEDVSGDFSQTSFSASRLAAELPHRINLRRRKAIAERFYREAFACWLEEQIETGEIELPSHAKSFQEAKDAYCACTWKGAGKVSADPYKDVMATEKALELGLTTLEEALSERGLDLETTIAQRKAEREMLEKAGLIGQPVYQANVQTRVMDEEDEDGAPAQRNAPKRKN